MVWYQSSLRIFGCSAYADVPKVERLKLDPKEGVIIDYGQKGYWLYDLEKMIANIFTTKVFVKLRSLTEVAELAD